MGFSDDLPLLSVDLSGEGGNVFALLGLAGQLVSKEDRAEMSARVFQGNSYVNSLDTISDYVDLRDTSGTYIRFPEGWDLFTAVEDPFGDEEFDVDPDRHP